MILPVVGSIVAQAGRPMAYHVAAVPCRSTGVASKGTPSEAVKVWVGAIINRVVVVPPPPPPPPLEVMTNATVVAVLVPPGPVAVTEIVVVPMAVGVPVMRPVEEFVPAQLGNPAKR